MYVVRWKGIAVIPYLSRQSIEYFVENEISSLKKKYNKMQESKKK